MNSLKIHKQIFEELLKKKFIHQSEVARRAKTSTSYISRLKTLSDTTTCSGIFAKRILEVFELSEADISTYFYEY